MNIKLQRKQTGFTLLEVLLVVAVIAVLAGIVILALNPGKNLSESRNSQRRVDVNTILNAVYQYALDNNGALPAGITTTVGEICDSTGAACTDPNPEAVDLGALTTNEEYLTAIPSDPQCGVGSTCLSNGVGYTIVKTANNRVTVAAPDAELSATISVTR